MKTKKQRESSFELLRIIAMLMVMILHADFHALGEPTRTELISSPLSSFIRVLFEVMSIGAVNIFVLISGWFGIRPSMKGFCSFAFQCLFFSIGIYITLLLSGRIDFSLRGVAGCFMLMPDSYWFIPSYICLYLFAPVLNTFINTAAKEMQLYVIIAFFIFQTLYSFLGGGGGFLMKGYSSLSFMGLYLLSNYVKRFFPIMRYKRHTYLMFYILCVIVLVLLFLFGICYEYDFISVRVLYYSNPLVILTSLSLLLYFSRLKFNNKTINWVAGSSFAAYLLHENPNLYKYYFANIRSVVNTHSFSEYLFVLFIVITWFVGAILIDQLRKMLWRIFNCSR